MTVTVRQLIRVSSVTVIPPPAVTMAFIQQPTDTTAGELFDPVVRVSISDGGLDSLTISPVSPNCADITPVTVTATAAGATFTGLRAGEITGPCRLRVHNNSRPQIPDIVSDPFDVLSLVPPWELISSASGFYNSGYATITLNTSGSTLIVLAWATVDPPQLGFFTDSLGNIGWQMATLASLTIMWLLNPTNVAASHTFILQGINNATGSGMAFFGQNPVVISSTNAFELFLTSSIAAPAVTITNNRQLVVTGLGTGNVAPSNISDPIVGYVAQIQPPTTALDGSGVLLHGSGIGQKLGVSGTEEQPVWIGFPAGPMSTRTLLFEAGA